MSKTHGSQERLQQSSRLGRTGGSGRGSLSCDDMTAQRLLWLLTLPIGDVAMGRQKARALSSITKEITVMK
jgi:hypothetical protein